MERPFTRGDLRLRLSAIPSWQRLTFGLGTCRRLLPGFEAYANDTGHAGLDELRSVLDAVDAGIGRDGSDFDFALRAAEVAELGPDEDATDHAFAPAALDAAAATSSLVDACLGGEIEPIVDIAFLAMDTVDLVVQEMEDMRTSGPDREARILRHPLMQDELRRQRQDLEMIERAGDHPSTAMPDIRAFWDAREDNVLGLPRGGQP